MARDLCLLWVSRRGLKTSQLRVRKGTLKAEGRLAQPLCRPPAGSLDKG